MVVLNNLTLHGKFLWNLTRKEQQWSLTQGCINGLTASLKFHMPIPLELFVTKNLELNLESCNSIGYNNAYHHRIICKFLQYLNQNGPVSWDGRSKIRLHFPVPTSHILQFKKGFLKNWLSVRNLKWLPYFPIIWTCGNKPDMTVKSTECVWRIVHRM